MTANDLNLDKPFNVECMVINLMLDESNVAEIPNGVNESKRFEPIRRDKFNFFPDSDASFLYAYSFLK